MQEKIKHFLIFSLGWLAILLGAIGLLLPIVPTTPFLILALGCFSKTSPRFHNMLLNNKWVGPPLREWDKTHTIQRHTKHKIMALIVVSFCISIAIHGDRPGLQLMLATIGLAVLTLIVRLKEPEDNLE